ncbi:hypothetical protein PG987_013284 [Apiospora arundinis]
MPGKGKSAGKGKGKAVEGDRGKTVHGGKGKTDQGGKTVSGGNSTETTHVARKPQAKWNADAKRNLLGIISQHGQFSIRITNWEDVYLLLFQAMGDSTPSYNTCQSRWSQDLKKDFEVLRKDLAQGVDSKAPQHLLLPDAPGHSPAPAAALLKDIPYAGSSRHRHASPESPYPDADPEADPAPPSRSHREQHAASSSNAVPLLVPSPPGQPTPDQHENAPHRIIHMYDVFGNETRKFVLPDEVRRIEIKDTFSINLPLLYPIDPEILRMEQRQHHYTPADYEDSPPFLYAHELDIDQYIEAGAFSTPSKAKQPE